jgi:flagellar biogenesis protein FliO
MQILLALQFPYRIRRCCFQSAAGESSRTLQNAIGLLSRAWRWIRARRISRSSTRRLQVDASVSLGEKRFVAVIQVDGLQFLIGGGATNVTLLAKLGRKESFGEVLNETMNIPKRRPAKGTKKQIVKPAVPQTLELAVKKGKKQA